MLKINQKGATSIIWVIAILTATILVSGFLGIMMKTMAINEIQGIMDMSGVIALRYALDETKLTSEEKLSVDSGIARAKFINLINENLNDFVGSDKLVTGYTIDSVSILKDNQTAIGRIQNRETYYLEAVIRATYRLNSVIDGAAIYAVNYFDFLWSNDNASVSVKDFEGDGTGNIIIRTVSRLALR